MCNIVYMTSQILKFADSWKTQNLKYFENKMYFFLFKTRKIQSWYIKDYNIAKDIMKQDINFQNFQMLSGKIILFLYPQKMLIF